MRRHLSLPLDLHRNTPLTFIVLALLAAVLALLPTTARSTVTWRGDYETGTLSQWNLGVQQKAEGRVSVGTNVIHQGRYAARFEVRPGDNNVAGSGTGERAEVLIGSSTTDGIEGREAYWAWSTFFPSDFSAPGGAWNVFTQFHHTGALGQSNIHFDVRDMSTIGFRVLGGDEAAAVRKDFTLASLQRGRWYDFVFHVKWSSSASTGFVEVWVNGNRVVPKTFTPTLYYGQGAYLKQGYYRSAYSGTTVVYHDGMRKGATYDEVAAEFGDTTSSTPPPPATGTPTGGSSSSTIQQSIAAGATLSGQVEWSVTTSSGSPARVEFLIDGTLAWTERYSPYMFNGDYRKLDTTTLADGAHVLTARVVAADGSSSTAAVNVTVANGGGSPPPSGSGGTSPSAGAVAHSIADGATLSGAVPWSATASGLTPTRVEFLVDGAMPWTERYAPYDYQGTPGGTLDTRKLLDGQHVLLARAIAADGTVASSSIRVTVANGAAAAAPSGATAGAVAHSIADGATLSGAVPWSATASGLTPTRVEFLVDGAMPWTERYAPYDYQGTPGGTLDTRKLLDGQHVLLARAIAADGTVASSSIRVTVANGAAAAAPTGGTATGGTATGGTSSDGTSSAGTSSGGTSSDPAPSVTLVSSIKDGDTITGSLVWEITPTGGSVSRIEFFIDDELKWTERIAPYRFGGDEGRLDTETLRRGWRTLVVKAYATDGSMVQLTLRVKVA